MDVAVPITRYIELLAEMQAEVNAHGLIAYTLSHAGNGNVHLNIAGRKDDPAEWDLVQTVSERLVLKTIALGGTATGEHGVGLGKRKYMPTQHGTGLAWMRRVKDLFDPNGILNPGKIFPG
jgi:D-lactate dehydrogenase (cytochrome)